MSDQVPDLAEPIVGYKLLRFHDHGCTWPECPSCPKLAPFPCFAGYSFGRHELGVILEATCKLRVDPCSIAPCPPNGHGDFLPHLPIPLPKPECGIYGYKTLEQAQDHRGSDKLSILSQHLFFGMVYEHTIGWRASHSLLQRIYLPKNLTIAHRHKIVTYAEAQGLPYEFLED